MNEIIERFTIIDDIFEVSTLGSIRKIISENSVELPKMKLINDRCYAVFSNRKIAVVDRLLRQFLNIKVMNNFIKYIDDNPLNTCMENILISSDNNFLGRVGSKCLYRPIVNAITYRKENLNSPTAAEKIMSMISKILDLKCEEQAVFFNDKSFYIIDFYFPKYKVAIELDGKHHIECMKTYFYDSNRSNYLKKNYNITTIRIPNQTVYSEKLRNELVKKIKEAIFKKRCKEENLIPSDFIKNKINIYKLLIKIFEQFEKDIRPLSGVEIDIKQQLNKITNDKIFFGSESKREFQLLKSIVYGILKNGVVFWKVKELTKACNTLGEINELYFSNKKTIAYLKYLSKNISKFIDINTNFKKITRGSVVYFKLTEPSLKIK